MDIEKLIETLRQHGVSCVRACGKYCSICDEAATALSTLQAENEEMLDENRRWSEATRTLSCAIENLRAELEQVKAERDAAKSTLAERIGVRGAEPITTAFGLPIDRLRELAKADREGRCGIPPVKMHQKIFRVFDGEIYEEIVCGAIWEPLMPQQRWKVFVMGHGISYLVDEVLGKTVFLTRAEAEAALKAREQDGE